VVYKLDIFATEITLGRVGIPVNIKQRKEVSKKGREKITIKVKFCEKNVQYKSTMQNEKKNVKIK
jgi:hypothetical protein